MPVKKTLEEFIYESKKIHGDKYDYTKVNYLNSSKKVIIICKNHGEFLMAPGKHLIGQGCKICSGRTPLTKESFLNRANKAHDFKYNYSQVIIKTSKDKVKIICKTHGTFEQTPLNHIKGQGCPDCGRETSKLKQRYTNKDFINSVKEKHKNRYNYSKVNYINSQTKIEIICPEHGSFYMKPNSHFNGQGCPKCGREIAKQNIALDFNEFLARANEIHGNEYIYEKKSYINYTSKMNMICKNHGVFHQTPHSHISMKTGCPDCGIIKAAESNKKSWEQVLDLFKRAHNNKYIYDSINYIDVSTKINILCPKHGYFEQKPYAHYLGTQCPQCSTEDVHEDQKIYFQEFMQKAIEQHDNRYKYFENEYIDIFTDTKIECEKHGVFYQKPRDHYRGSGCPKCISSRGENEIRNILIRNNFKFEEQYKFDDLKNINHLKCDFYIKSKNVVIEYNGKQHYEPVEIFGGEKALIETKKRDKIKYKFLLENNINLIIIKYDIEDIEKNILTRLEKLESTMN